jgi:hypothetical protein
MRWNKLGDINTTYFHAIATHQRKSNYIMQITDPNNPDSLITGEASIQQHFDQFYKDLLGTRTQQTPATTPPMTPLPTLLNTTTDLTGLAVNFIELEVKNVIFHLAKGKASGPDGFPNEFFQQYWSTIKGDILQVLNNFYDHKVDL